MSADEGTSPDDDAATTPNDDVGRGLQSLVVPLLQVACNSQTPVSVMAAHMSLSCSGRLRAVSTDGVLIEIPNPPDGVTRGSTAAVTFPSNGETKGFVAEVTRTDTGAAGEMLVTLALPDRLRAGTRRSAVRIPVPTGTLTAVLVQGDGVRGSVTPVDMSLSGILIETDAPRAERLDVGAAVSLRIALGSLELLIPCEVRRKDGRRLGLLFVTDGPPPKRLAKFMWRLQQDRLLATPRRRP